MVLPVVLVGFATQGEIPLAFGFGVRAPASLPIDWDQSFSFLSMEFLAHPNLTFLCSLGTYPNHFPDLFQSALDIVVKGWAGPLACYAGGGMVFKWLPVAGTWAPLINVTAGMQLWIIDSVNIAASVSSLDTLPPSWIFSPEVSISLHFSLCPSDPRSLPEENGFYLWTVVGLIMAGLFVYYQHS
jgi:hypothetical protein